MASIQRGSSEREQALIFESEVAEEHQRFADQLDATIENFDNGVTFIDATFPSTLAEYRRFFANSARLGGISDLDPGITLIEAVPPDDVSTLVDREESLGNPDLRVLSLGALLNNEHMVITRTANPVNLMGFPIIGLDVGSLGADVFNNIYMPDNGRTMYVLDEQSSLGALFENGAEASEANLVVILESINDPVTGEVRGWAAQFFDPVLFIRTLPERTNPRINVAVEMLGATEMISDVAVDSTVDYDTASLTSEIADNTHDLPWKMKMWAADDLGVSTGIFGQVEVWIFGLLATFGFGLVSIWRALQEHQLDQAAFELEHARTLAATDPLTGLLNRQGFLEIVDSMDHFDGGTIFFIDLDGFKRVNDTSGHAEGDRVLRVVADRLREQFRGADIVSRFGGDEFVVFAPGLAGERIATAISQRVVAAIAKNDNGISASLGTATLEPGSSDMNQVLQDADAAMYRAKELGGNQFTSTVS